MSPSEGRLFHLIEIYKTEWVPQDETECFFDFIVVKPALSEKKMQDVFLYCFLNFCNIIRSKNGFMKIKSYLIFFEKTIDYNEMKLRVDNMNIAKPLKKTDASNSAFLIFWLQAITFFLISWVKSAKNLALQCRFTAEFCQMDLELLVALAI